MMHFKADKQSFLFTVCAGFTLYPPHKSHRWNRG